MTRRDRTTREDSHARLARETTALRQVFDDTGEYEIRTPDGIRMRLFVVSRRPWRFARVNRMEARRAEVQG